LLTLHSLGKSQRGKVLMNNERLMIFMYLIKNPIVMARLLTHFDLPSVHLASEDVYSVTSLAVNMDSLFDNEWIKGLLKHAASIGFLETSYRKADGFVYNLTESGELAVSNLAGNYFDKVRKFLHALGPIKGESNSSLNAKLNEIFRR
jgi:hypothetical protein